jgi:hypothetical protein
VYCLQVIVINKILPDLNYRIDLPDVEVRTLLDEPRDQGIDLLLNYDQVGCMEGYATSADTYDMRSL